MKEEGRLPPETKAYGEAVWARLNAVLDRDGRGCPRPPVGVVRELRVLH